MKSKESSLVLQLLAQKESEVQALRTTAELLGFETEAMVRRSARATVKAALRLRRKAKTNGVVEEPVGVDGAPDENILAMLAKGPLTTIELTKQLGYKSKTSVQKRLQDLRKARKIRVHGSRSGVELAEILGGGPYRAQRIWELRA